MIIVNKTAIEGVMIIEPKIFGDSRGYFYDSFSQRDFDAATGKHIDFERLLAQVKNINYK